MGKRSRRVVNIGRLGEISFGFFSALLREVEKAGGREDDLFRLVKPENSQALHRVAKVIVGEREAEERSR
jgi:hypothetical protein